MPLLARHHADISVANKDGNTPLHSATGNGQIAVVLSFIELGTDMYMTGMAGLTSVHIACIEKNQELISALITRYGADIYVSATEHKITPVQILEGNLQKHAIKIFNLTTKKIESLLFFFISKCLIAPRIARFVAVSLNHSRNISRVEDLVKMKAEGILTEALSSVHLSSDDMNAVFKAISEISTPADEL